ncbi:MAG: hypothetical protein L3J57_01675 [Desulfuromusa sp.]|nr:hypothetical protein [Desulfuromusa sp.]
MAAEKLEQKHLKGLKFNGSRPVMEKVDGKETGKILSWKPFERALQEKDVLSFAERDNEIVIVAADGKKHYVAK